MTNVQRSRRQVRLSRALGIALTPKAQRIFEKRPYAPGEHGRDRRRTESDYAVRMREKQRLRAQYGISEKQLRAAYEKATRTAGQTGNAMLTDLETRLDNLVLRAGFARTTAQARQFVVHRHILDPGAGQHPVRGRILRPLIRALWSTNPGHTARTPRFFREAAGFLRCRAITGRTPPGESSSRTHRHRSYSDECRHR